ncbi:hypothetical protein [Sphaerisporangium perillae]|uniref:hypothetical protein n=1 Tax=Sphaerisporangium perillae TaxID=2935860 RepID=UPI00200E5BD1|nr:hypothetical protein [Sphaerisporangium perillae]
MSVDLGVWYERTPITAEEAARKYAAWCAGESLGGCGALPDTAEPSANGTATAAAERPGGEGTVMGAAGPAPEVLAFYDALTGDYPDLTDGDYQTSPWATPLTVGDDFVVMSIVFPRAGEICRAVLELAGRHNLVCFDPRPDHVPFRLPMQTDLDPYGAMLRLPLV